ncbi:unnamed protein product [Prorocentrum cordatum]|uniref:Uncharacterized protein n=1 Tax=Prorocentrum cordatum TaxID=2364126 RepID=A0ABN9VGZ3_9DINO|nr:unnamed protein product [Polarella glacialis]
MAAAGCTAAFEAAEQHKAAAGGSLWPVRRARRAAARHAADGRLAAAYRRVEELESIVRALEDRLDVERARHQAAADQAMALAKSQGIIAVPDAALVGELVPRLALAVPILEGVLAGPLEGKTQAAEPVMKARRNTGLHCAAVPATGIASAGMLQLSRWQRQGRGRRLAALSRGPRRSIGRGPARLGASGALGSPPSVGLPGSRRAAHAARGGGRDLRQGRAPSVGAVYRRLPAQRSAAESVPADWAVAVRRRGLSVPAGAKLCLAEKVRKADARVLTDLTSGPKFWPEALESSGRDAGGRPGVVQKGGGEHVVSESVAEFVPAARCDDAEIMEVPPNVDGQEQVLEIGGQKQELEDEECLEKDFDTPEALGDELDTRHGGDVHSEPLGLLSSLENQGIQLEEYVQQLSFGDVLSESLGVRSSKGYQGRRLETHDGKEEVTEAFGKVRLKVLQRHMATSCHDTDFDRDLRRPGWRMEAEADSPTPATAAERRAGLAWLRGVREARLSMSEAWITGDVGDQGGWVS